MNIDLGYERSDDERLIDQLMEEDVIVMTSACMAVSNSSNIFTEHELLNKDQHFVCPDDGVRDQLILLRRVSSYFRKITNFSADEFEELSSLVCTIIESNAHSTGQPRSVFGMQPKLSAQQRHFLFVLYLHDNNVRLNAFRWKWAKFSTCNDILFVSSCINGALSDELHCPCESERMISGQTIPRF